jgi:hypothetical protein
VSPKSVLGVGTLFASRESLSRRRQFLLLLYM